MYNSGGATFYRLPYPLIQKILPSAVVVVVGDFDGGRRVGRALASIVQRLRGRRVLVD